MRLTAFTKAAALHKLLKGMSKENFDLHHLSSPDFITYFRPLANTAS